MADDHSKQPLPVSIAREVRQSVLEKSGEYLKIIKTMVNIDSGADCPAGTIMALKSAP